MFECLLLLSNCSPTFIGNFKHIQELVSEFLQEFLQTFFTKFLLKSTLASTPGNFFQCFHAEALQNISVHQITPVIFLVIPLDLSLFFQVVILGFIQDIPQALLQRVLHVAYAVISPEASQ